MRNALILTGLWLGILITAYAIVFWGNGIDRPLPISVLDQQMATATESEYAQPDGLFKNPADFWSALDNQIKPSVNYMVTLPLDLEMMETAPVVLEKELRMKQREASMR